jgi:hypothetical protein
MVCCAGGKQQQYAWDGSKIVAINQDLLDEGYTAAGDQTHRQHAQPAWIGAAAVQTRLANKTVQAAGAS